MTRKKGLFLQIKTSQTDLFDMEWYMDNAKNEIEIDAPFLFDKIEKKLKGYLLEEQPEGDSTDGPIQFRENLTNKIQKNFDKIIGDSVEKKASSSR